MKRSDTGDFCVLYVEPSDEKTALFQVIMEQKKPLVIMLAEQAHVFQRPEDFAELKHIKRHLDISVVFIIFGSEHLIQLAGRHGFPVYLSMEALSNALASGQVTRQRAVPRKTVPLNATPLPAYNPVPQRAMPQHATEEVMRRRTVPLPGQATAPYTPYMHPTASEKTATLVSPVRTEAMSGPLPPARMTRSGPLPPARTAVSGPLPPIRTAMPGPMPMRPPERVAMLEAPARPVPPGTPVNPVRPFSPERPPKTGRNRFAVGILLLMLFALITAGVGYFLIVSHSMPTGAPAMTNTLVGSVSFLSSNQLSESSNQGLNDKVLVNLNNIEQPAVGKSYYAWLMSDQNQGDTKAILLGQLQVNHGNAQLLYAGDQNHTNLLVMTSRFLVTEEGAATPPLTPSPDPATWSYYGEIAQAPINATDNVQHFSYLDHLRHLLASDPTMNELELPGGLNTWFYRNTSKILEWTGSTRESWQETNDAGFVHRQTLRTLTYLDGVSFVQQDLPPGTGLNVNERLARIGLLDINGPNQDPSDYLDHVSHHLYGLLEASTVTPDLRHKITAILNSLTNVNAWLVQIRHDALQIMKMSDQALHQPGTLSLLNDMIDNATHAFVGQVDPTTGQMHPGVTWIYDQIQALGTLAVKRLPAHSSSLQLVPGTNVRRAFVHGGNNA